jgi:hypothetical protein
MRTRLLAAEKTTLRREFRLQRRGLLMSSTTFGYYHCVICKFPKAKKIHCKKFQEILETLI